ncbi:hypothetical protein [Halodesulfovibrio marinisediminis]|uniref:Uncharacterized protein n=1 Tax=Halodesulfovibrio marinisediminis DSM 17456 TaxID=1121457 RepID=A0A1N6HYX0_9BACT|nr:hypothetical protein [Halodesulfovibrio marinisediminis]SIO24839.1 hypothetical protein SAMN02745161_2281 [Halodesulfovibrio marinisediminis DSM 17456]
MMKNILSLFFLVLFLCSVNATDSVAQTDSAIQKPVMYRELFAEPRVTTLLSLDAYKDKTPVTKKHLQDAFVSMMDWKALRSGMVHRYNEYAIFKELNVSWAGDTNAAVTLIQWLYKNGVAVDYTRTTYFFTLQYIHDATKGVYEVRCSANDMVTESGSETPKRVLNRYRKECMWPPSVEEQDREMLSLFTKEYRYFNNWSVKFKRVEPFHAEVVTTLDKKYIEQMLRQQLPAKRTALRVAEDGVYWGDKQIVTVTQEEGQNRITADFDLHYTISMDGKKLKKADSVPHLYLLKTFKRSLVRCDVKGQELKRIRKYTVEEYLKKLEAYIFSE